MFGACDRRARIILCLFIGEHSHSQRRSFWQNKLSAGKKLINQTVWAFRQLWAGQTCDNAYP